MVISDRYGRKGDTIFDDVKVNVCNIILFGAGLEVCVAF